MLNPSELRLNNKDWNRMVPPFVISIGNDSKTLEDAKRYIYEIDFSMLIYKITQDDPNVARLWDEESANQAVSYYRNYLWLIRKYSHIHPVLPPSVEVDEIWHHHILDTYKYSFDCNRIFGQYFHHYPYFGMRGSGDRQNLANAFHITQELHFTEFGAYILSFEEVDVHALQDD